MRLGQQSTTYDDGQNEEPFECPYRNGDYRPFGKLEEYMRVSWWSTRTFTIGRSDRFDATLVGWR
jgi:hypothetical protein